MRDASHRIIFVECTYNAILSFDHIRKNYVMHWYRKLVIFVLVPPAVVSDESSRRWSGNARISYNVPRDRQQEESRARMRYVASCISVVNSSITLVKCDKDLISSISRTRWIFTFQLRFSRETRRECIPQRSGVVSLLRLSICFRCVYAHCGIIIDVTAVAGSIRSFMYLSIIVTTCRGNYTARTDKRALTTVMMMSLLEWSRITHE